MDLQWKCQRQLFLCHYFSIRHCTDFPYHRLAFCLRQTRIFPQKGIGMATKWKRRTKASPAFTINLQLFHEFFWQFFSWNQSCQQLKSPKPQHFHEFFPPKKSTIFSGNQSWIFGQKIKISNTVRLPIIAPAKNIDWVKAGFHSSWHTQSNWLVADLKYSV